MGKAVPGRTNTNLNVLVSTEHRQTESWLHWFKDTIELVSCQQQQLGCLPLAPRHQTHPTTQGCWTPVDSPVAGKVVRQSPPPAQHTQNPNTLTARLPDDPKWSLASPSRSSRSQPDQKGSPRQRTGHLRKTRHRGRTCDMSIPGTPRACPNDLPQSPEHPPVAQIAALPSS